MKKMPSVVVALCAAVSFAAVLNAAEPAKKSAGPAPAAPAAKEIKKEETKPARKKGGKAKPAKKRLEEKKETVSPSDEKK